MRSVIKKYEDFATNDSDPIFRTQFFVVIMRPTKWPNDAKYGIRVTKKTVGKHATKRNFAKRRLRELIREFENKLSRDHDYIFVARAAILDADYQHLRQMMAMALKKIKHENSAAVLD